MNSYKLKQVTKGWQIIHNKEVVGKHTYPTKWQAQAYLKRIEAMESETNGSTAQSD